MERWLQATERALSVSQAEATEQLQARSSSRHPLGIFADIRGAIAVLRADIARVRGQLLQAIDLAQAALARLPIESVDLRAAATWILGLAYWMRGDLAAASQAFVQSKQYGQAADNITDVVDALFFLGQLQITQGQLQAAAQSYREAAAVASNQGGRLPAAMTAPFCGLSELLYEWNDLDAALHHALEAIMLGKRRGAVALLAKAYLVLARIKQALGDGEGAHAALQRAHEYAPTSPFHRVFAPLATHQARLWIAQGQLTAAAQWRQQAGLASDDELNFLREGDHITLARLLLVQGIPAGAMHLLRRLQEAAETGGRRGRVIEILILQAVALQAQDNRGQALAALTRALSLAEPEGNICSFIDEGATLHTLLLTCKRRTVNARLRAYMDKLLLAFAGDLMTKRQERTLSQPLPSSHHASALGQVMLPLVEPLSERELEVLRLIAAGLSNQAIAQQLVITVGTVKTHINNPYGKLQAGSRTQAVARAQELKLL